MKRWNILTSRRLLSAAAMLLLGSLAAQAGTVSGVVHNGTNSNKTAAGVDVLLIQLQGGMSVVASTKTDADGRYHFDNPGIGQGPMLIRAVYRGVFFHQPLTPGTSTVDVTVYEPTTNPAAIQVPLRLLVFQPNGDKLMVGEEYSIQNNSNPPAAYFKQDGNFEFTIPAGRGTRSGFHVWSFGHARAPGHDRQGQGPLRHLVRLSTGTKRRTHLLHRAVYRQSSPVSRIFHV